MAYTPSEWSCGDIVTADKLNNIERGIAEMNSEYVPTSWQCGDLITAEAMNKIEQGIADAGGGSSDFSTAQVTVVNTMSSSAESTKLSVPTINPPSTLISSTFISMPEDTDNISVVLYKDGTLIDISEFDASTEFAVSGDAELLSRPIKGIRIFGDCTITIRGGK